MSAFCKEKRMMDIKIKCGTDIIEINRIKELIGTNEDKFVTRVFTKQEIAYCEGKNKMKYQHYAVRFAAKEAVFKAISDVLKDKYQINWKNIEILDNEQGRPFVNILDMNLSNLKQIDISLSHCKEYAVANVVAVIE